MKDASRHHVSKGVAEEPRAGSLMGMAKGPSTMTVLLFKSGFVQHTLKRFPLSH